LKSYFATGYELDAAEAEVYPQGMRTSNFYTRGISNSNCSEGQMRAYKITRWPHYDADATMAGAQFLYLACKGGQFATLLTCQLRHWWCVMETGQSPSNFWQN